MLRLELVKYAVLLEEVDEVAFAQRRRVRPVPFDFHAADFVDLLLQPLRRAKLVG
jgi:hypothetical protein